MALIKCPECGKEISDKAKACPGCGYTRSINERKRETRKEKKPLSVKLKKRIKLISIGFTLIIFIVCIGVLSVKWLIPMMKYRNATSQMEKQNYEEAIRGFEELEGYENSADQVFECNYLFAKQRAENKDYNGAIAILTKISTYKDSRDLISEYEDAVVYVKATELMDNENYSEAVKELSSIKNYFDAAEKIVECNKILADNLFEEKKYKEAISKYEISDIKSNKYYEACYIVAKAYMKDKNYNDAITFFDKCGSYSDAQSKRSTCKAQKEKMTGFFYKKTGGGYYMLYIKYDLDNKLVAFEGYNPNDISLATSYIKVDDYSQSLGTSNLKSIGDNKYTFKDMAGYKITMKYQGNNVKIVSGTVQGSNDGLGIWKRYR